MRKCTRIGINVTGLCNCNCTHCFYRWSKDVKAMGDRTLESVIAEAADGQRRGGDHIVIVGHGEPCLWKHLIPAIKEFKQMGLTSSIITNGTVPLKNYEELREAGLNHIHVSVHHGYDPNTIMGNPQAAERQQELFKWLLSEKWKWRANCSIQKLNYTRLLSTALKCQAYYCKHFVSLGFLPLYEWSHDFDRARTVIVDPKESSPYIADLADCILDQEARYPEEAMMLSIRYCPMCLLPKEAWKYVVNARYVIYDHGEWEYQSVQLSDEEHWKRAVDFGNSVAITGAPCCNCDLFLHCGGYNKTMVSMYPECGIHAIKDPEIQQIPGWLHDQNRFIREFRGWY
jgi:hypothetical protein